MNEILDGTRLSLCLAFMIYASWSDWKNREVSNAVWLILGPTAFLLTSFHYVLFAPHLLQFYILSFVTTSALSMALFYAGAFGGADAKALICLSLALPYYPIYLSPSPIAFVSPLLPITVFSNAVLLAALSVFYAALRNSLWKLKTGRKLFDGFEKESNWRKILTFLCGYKVNVAALEKSGHMYPLEDIQAKETGESERRLLLMPKDEEREKIVERILRAAQEGKLQNEVWVTPGLPMLIFITAGLIVALIFGDIVWVILSSMTA